MLQTSPCCMAAPLAGPVAVSDDPFSPMIVLDYYDGPASGFLRCKVCGTTYHFFMLDWDDMHIVRIFALAPAPEGTFQRLADLFRANPDQHIWIPPAISRATEEGLSDLYDRGIQDLIDQATTPTLAIAWSVRMEKTLAIRRIDSANAPHLSSWFDRQPHPVLFDWFEYLRVARLVQAA